MDSRDCETSITVEGRESVARTFGSGVSIDSEGPDTAAAAIDLKKGHFNLVFGPPGPRRAGAAGYWATTAGTAPWDRGRGHSGTVALGHRLRADLQGCSWPAGPGAGSDRPSLGRSALALGGWARIQVPARTRPGLGTCRWHHDSGWADGTVTVTVT